MKNNQKQNKNNKTEIKDKDPIFWVILFLFLLGIFSLLIIGTFWIVKEYNQQEKIRSEINKDLKTAELQLSEIKSNFLLLNSKLSKFPKPLSLPEHIFQLSSNLDLKIFTIIARSVRFHSKSFSLPENLIWAIIKQESSFKLLSVSSANCKGLMQINPKAHKDKIKELNLKSNEVFHIDNNIFLGCKILKSYLIQTNSIKKSLQKYVGDLTGDKSQKYISSILSTFTDLEIANLKIVKKISLENKAILTNLESAESLAAPRLSSSDERKGIAVSNGNGNNKISNNNDNIIEEEKIDFFRLERDR